jgi:predicted  nucleic acid-binding Zn-ribbon protein
MNEITLKDEAIRIDNEIQMWANNLGTAVYNIGRCMTQMKERMLYLELGYDTFEDYCLQKYQLKRSQAAKYISVYQNLDEKYILDNQGAGIQKLYMISQISEEDRENIEGTPEELSVTELKAQIEQLKKEREGEQLQFFEMQEKSEKAKTEEDKLREKIRKLEDQIKDAEIEHRNELSDVSRKNEKLEKQIKELESKPQDVAVIEPTEEEIMQKAEELAAERSEEIIRAERQDWTSQIEELKEQLKAKEQETENIKAGYEKKLENLAGSTPAEAEESTQVDAAEEEKARMKELLTYIINASNEALELAQLSENSEMWMEKLRAVFGSISQKLEGDAF